jgi:uncharacterized protein (DUF2132 family)
MMNPIKSVRETPWPREKVESLDLKYRKKA